MSVCQAVCIPFLSASLLWELSFRCTERNDSDQISLEGNRSENLTLKLDIGEWLGLLALPIGHTMKPMTWDYYGGDAAVDYIRKLMYLFGPYRYCSWVFRTHDLHWIPGMNTEKYERYERGVGEHWNCPIFEWWLRRKASDCDGDILRMLFLYLIIHVISLFESGWLFDTRLHMPAAQPNHIGGSGSSGGQRLINKPLILWQC